MSAASGDDPVALWARRLGGYVWLEGRLFELLGRWSAGLRDDRAAVTAAVHSRHHGWRAEQWQDHLPLLGTAAPHSFVAAPSAGAGDLMAAVGGVPITGDDAGAVGLAGVYRVVLPRLLGAYDDHGEVATAVAEAPTRRLLRIVGADLRHDLSEGERLVERLGRSLDDPAVLTGHVDRLDGLADAAGSLSGGGVTDVAQG